MNSKAFIVFLVVSLLVSSGLVLYFAKRHPHPRFRPKRGEVFLLSLFLCFLSAGFSFFMSQLFEHDWDLNKGKKDVADELARPSGAGDEGTKRDADKDEDGDSADDDSLPPFLKENNE